MPSFRFNANTVKELEYIKQALGSQNSSKAVVESIHAYYKQLKETERKQPLLLDRMEELGLIGCIQSEETTLSTEYKKELTRSLEKKYRSDEAKDNS